MISFRKLQYRARMAQAYDGTPSVVHAVSEAEAREGEWRQRATVVLESNITFDDIDLVPEWKSNRELLIEAVAACVAKAWLCDKRLYNVAVKNHTNPSVMHKVWKALHASPARFGGATDWESTVFETIRCRKHLYEDEYTEGMFEVQYGDNIRFFAGLNDPRVMTAVAWLEGDNNVTPVNGRRDQHRDNGDWILEFDSGKRNRKGEMMTYKVIVHAASFNPHAIEDRDECCWENIELKRGRKPSSMQVIPDNLIDSNLIEAIAAAEEEETVVTMELSDGMDEKLVTI